MRTVTLSPDDSESLHPFGRPTTVRLTLADLASLDAIRLKTNITRNGLVGLAVAALLDHVSRTGKLPCPQAKTRSKGGIRGIA